MLLFTLFGGLFVAVLFVDSLNSMWESGGVVRRILATALFIGTLIVGIALLN